MHRLGLLIMSVALLVTASAKNQDKQYVEGKVVATHHDEMAVGTLAMMSGNAEDRYTYTISSKEGQYKVWETSRGEVWFKPLQVSPGDMVMFRVNNKRNVLYIPLNHGEKSLIVSDFKASGGN